MRFCPNCGATSSEAARFCTECGMTLPAAVSQVSQPTWNVDESRRMEPVGRHVVETWIMALLGLALLGIGVGAAAVVQGATHPLWGQPLQLSPTVLVLPAILFFASIFVFFEATRQWYRDQRLQVTRAVSQRHSTTVDSGRPLQLVILEAALSAIIGILITLLVTGHL